MYDVAIDTLFALVNFDVVDACDRAAQLTEQLDADWQRVNALGDKARFVLAQGPSLAAAEFAHATLADVATSQANIAKARGRLLELAAQLNQMIGS